VPTSGLPAASAACLTCLTKSANCCTEIAACYATDPNNECGYGGPPDNPGETEYLCFQSCVLDVATENGGFYDDDDEATCAASCTRCGTISNETNDVITCMHLKCEAECLTP
jgi:hypothetical protein